MATASKLQRDFPQKCPRPNHAGRGPDPLHLRCHCGGIAGHEKGLSDECRQIGARTAVPPAPTPAPCASARHLSLAFERLNAGLARELDIVPSLPQHMLNGSPSPSPCPNTVPPCFRTFGCLLEPWFCGSEDKKMWFEALHRPQERSSGVSQCGCSCICSSCAAACLPACCWNARTAHTAWCTALTFLPTLFWMFQFGDCPPLRQPLQPDSAPYPAATAHELTSGQGKRGGGGGMVLRCRKSTGGQ